MNTNDSIREILDHFFRHESAKIKSHLIRAFDASHIEAIEDAVQEALIKAMQTWPFKGIPQNPSAWILQVARNYMLDLLRRESNYESKIKSIQFEKERFRQDQYSLNDSESVLDNDLLQMMFTCCDPSLSLESQIILTLKILCGFSNNEVANALFKNEAAIAKAYTRAKLKLKELNLQGDHLSPNKIFSRLPSVLHVLYLLFNEGYQATSGEALINEDVCEEAMYLVSVLLQHEKFRKPEVYALLSLMCFQAARLHARISADGTLMNIAEQDRSKWNAALIAKGEEFLDLSATENTLSEYHLQAAIAWCHCQSKDYESTNWNLILGLYDQLIALNSNPVAGLHRIVAFSKVHGAEKALEEMKKISGYSMLADYYLHHAIKAELLFECGKQAEAIALLQRAHALVQNETEKKFISRKLEKWQQPQPAWNQHQGSTLTFRL